MVEVRIFQYNPQYVHLQKQWVLLIVITVNVIIQLMLSHVQSPSHIA
jgi:hypothetical protein